MLSVDLNCDLGEGFPHDQSIMPLISSANIACGFHAGDRDTMRETVELAVNNKVAIGAHPSFPDKKNFGRTDLTGTSVLPGETGKIVEEQLVFMREICVEKNAVLHHVKLHGALYNRAAWDEEVSKYVCDAIVKFDPAILLYGPAGSRMKEIAESFQLKFISEAFVDRGYADDGSLTPRAAQGAMITDQEESGKQALAIVNSGKLNALSGKTISVAAETICIHGDAPGAASLAKYIHDLLIRNSIAIRPPE